MYSLTQKLRHHVQEVQVQDIYLLFTNIDVKHGTKLRSYCFNSQLGSVWHITRTSLFTQIDDIAQKREKLRGSQRECSSKPLKHSIVKRILAFKRQI